MLHSWVGGRGKYSLSTLDFSAYDPLFFLIHANTDRIWAIWQALQSYRGLPWDRSDCALNHMRDSLQPFANAVENEDYLTLKYSHPNDVWDYSDHLEYHYDSLELNGWSIPELERFWRGRRVTTACSLASCCTTSGHRPTWRSSSARPREGGRNCDHPAGKFSLLGGEYEMPFSFDRNYKFDISEPVRKLGFHLDRKPDFELKIQIHSYNGSYLDPHLLDQPSIIFEPGHRKDEVHEEQSDQAHSGDALIRRNVWALSMLERRSLVLALKGLEEDHSADGFQSLASFHALPELCPEPTASHRFACCEHGSAVFPQWHRLYTVQFEEALRRHGSLVGIPYWDTTDAQMRLPFFFSEQTFHDPIDDKDIPNPWLGADIDFEKSHTEREVNMARLQAEGEHGYDTWTWEQVMLALEQENYCDFEVQFEMAHNAIHAWIGGTKVHSMAHLHYASYDPVFILHHSSMDRIFAIWQELQRLRGYDPNVADCALDIMHKPLKPFTFGSPYNLNPDTKRYSRPDDIFDYRSHFHYEYDDLELQGLNPAQLEDRIHQRKDHERVFAGFMLHGIGTSAHVEFDVCSESNVCTAAGDFNILGGSAEMPWKFDRVYKYDITGVLNKKHIDPRDHFTFKLKITALNGTVLDSHLFPEPDVIIQPAAEEQGKYDMPANHIRHSLSDLNERDILSLKSSLNDLQHDEGKLGWQSLASYHGVPALCPTPEKAEYACCIHGMPTFPHWHRLYTLAVEHALNDHGSAIAIPYWDWTLPQEHLPEIFTEQTYYDAWKDEDGEHSVLFDEVLLALEQEDYCDFEVQFEELQRRRHKPADRADCAVNFMAQPMHPFDSVDLDPDANIRAHAVPNTVFNYFDLDLATRNWYDITDALHEAHIEPEDLFDAHAPFYLEYEIHAVNGSALPKSVISRPTLVFEKGHEAAEFACCVHGMPTFPHWHRLYTLEDDYCNFEVQFEVTHNAIHYLELQKRRHKPYNTADCAAKYMDEPMHPFDDPELDPDDFVRSHAVAHDAFDYHSLGYQYDNLDVGGKHIEEIEELIREHQSHPRVFAGFHLEGIGTSADVTFYVCKGEHDENDDCHRAGAFFILGGSKEMPWSFDRLYKYDITDVLHDMHIEPEDAIADHAPFHFDWVIHNVNGSTMPASTISAPRIMYAPSANKIRHNLNDLSSSDLASLEWALDKVQHDQGALGYQALAAYHGVPALCPTPEAAEFACCVHGMPTFPHWHRLYTLEVEHALLAQGSHVAIPYWDWTLAMDHLPEVLTRSTYFNEEHGRQEPNPFSHGYIAEAQEDTVRDPQPQLWKKSKDGEHSVLFDEVLLALEQEDYCDFEIQFEVTHNAIHYLVGGHNEHSLASLHYSGLRPRLFPAPLVR
nr:hypothetical protein BaRGS_007645 [Batillaria attramentaria]